MRHKNRMQDLDFEQTETTDKIEDYEFTRRAAKRFRQIVSVEEFDGEDADVIFRYLYKEMELVSFGDQLKRYIYERAGLTGSFNSVPDEVYREIIIDSFKETCTPKSMNPSSTKLSALAGNWLIQAFVKRETVFLLGFGLRMSEQDVSDFLTSVLREQDFDFRNPEEVIFWYCYKNQLSFAKAQELKTLYNEMDTSVSGEEEEGHYLQEITPETREELLSYLYRLKNGKNNPASEKKKAYDEFTELLAQAKQIIASMYQQDEKEKGSSIIWKAEDITPSDIEKVICNGIPLNQMGNLKKMSASILAKHFSQKRFSRQRITTILNGRMEVERFDLITLEFFIISQKMPDVDPYIRYRAFLEEIQKILENCGMGEIYIVNPYECFLLMCLLTDCPLAVFSEIWEMSYEEENSSD